jgi:predicted dithiol-disulfide oxidoreductase (DUF899 family)
MTLPDVVSHKEWLDARKALLIREKELTRLRDTLNADRRRLPMTRIEKDYVFTGPRGTARLRDMFGESHQLVVQHVMFDPAWDDACPGCTAGLDEMAPAMFTHLRQRDTEFVAISRAPYPKLADYSARRGWDFLPWYSSHGSDFNYDFHASIDASVAPVEVNYRNAEELRAAGMGWATEKPQEMSGFSCFLRSPGRNPDGSPGGDDIFHTYSTWGRGTELGGTYGLLDITALGRQEDWEEPKGRAFTVHGADPSFTS